MNDVGSRLRELRRERRMSQAQLAGSRFTASYVSHLERGTRQVSPEALEHFAAQLGVSEAELSGDSATGDRAAASALAIKLQLEVEDASRRGDHRRVVELAEQRHSGLGAGAHPQLWWVVQYRRTEAHLALDQPGEALATCTELGRARVTQQDPGLHLRTLVLRAHAASALKRHGEAIDAARHAVERGRDQSLSLRLRAVRALIAVASVADEESALVEAHTGLVALLVQRVPARAGGEAFWELGAAWLDRGTIRLGLACLDQAAELMRGQVDLRTWGLFCRDSAHRRMEAGLGEGVGRLVQECTASLNRAGTAADRAEAMLVAAQLAVLKDDWTEAARLLAIADLSLGDSQDGVLALRARLRTQVDGAGGASADAARSSYAAVRPRRH